MRACLLIVLWSTLASAAEVHLLETASVAGDRALLGDIAVITAPEQDAERLRSLAVQNLPDVGERRVTAGRVRARIHHALPGLRVVVAGDCLVRRTVDRFSSEDIAAAAIAELSERLGPFGDDARIGIERAAPAQILPATDGQPFRMVAEPISRSDWGEIPYRVRFLKDGREQARTLLVLRLERYRETLVAGRDLPRGATLSAADVTMRRERITSRALAAAPALEAAIGTVTRTAIAAGTPLTWGLIRRPPLVRGGTQVELIVRSDTFVLTIAGVALADGLADEWVGVRPHGGGRVVQGRIIGPGRVLVE